MLLGYDLFLYTIVPKSKGARAHIEILSARHFSMETGSGTRILESRLNSIGLDKIRKFL